MRTRLKTLLWILLLSCGALLEGCGFAAGIKKSNVLAQLSYSENPAVYERGVSIDPNTPSAIGDAPTEYSVSPDLPDGLNLSSVTGIISGAPTVVSAKTEYTITASNQDATVTAKLSITVVEPDLSPKSLKYSSNPAKYAVGYPISPNTPSAEGGAPTAFSVTPPLPGGLTLNSPSGTISGTPTSITPSASYAITASNTYGSTTTSITIEILDPSFFAPGSLTYSENPAFYFRGVPIPANIASTANAVASSFSVNPSLPSGLTLDSASGVISGTPAATLSQTDYLVTASNVYGEASAVVTITISNLPAPSAVGYAENPATYIKGGAISPNVPTVTGSYLSFSVSPSLPSGLSLDSKTGIVSGIPTAASLAKDFTVTVTNAGGTSSTSLNLRVATSPPLWTPNGPVKTLALDGNTLYVGGSFSHLGPYTGSGLLFDTFSGAKPAFAFWPPINGPVYSVVPDPNPNNSGGFYIGGAFTEIGTASRNGLARIFSDGSVDMTWDPDVAWLDAHTPATVEAIATDGNIVYVGGNFQSIGGSPRSNLAAIDAASGIPTSWSTGTDFPVHAMLLVGTTLYIGGEFLRVGAVTRYYLAAINTVNALPTSWNPNPNNSVFSLAQDGGYLYVGGRFTSTGFSGTRTRLAAFLLSSGSATALNPSIDNDVLALLISGTTLYVGGAFGVFDGVARNHLASIPLTNGDGNVSTWDPDADDAVTSLLRVGNTIFVGGDFTTVGGQARSNLASVDGITGVVSSWTRNVDGRVRAIAGDANKLFVGGDFVSIGGVKRKNIAAIDLATGEATSWNPSADKAVNEVAIDPGGVIYAGGEFINIGGQGRNYIAAINPSTGLATGWSPGFSQSMGTESVDAIAISGNTLYAGGNYTVSGPRKFATAIDRTTGAFISWDTHLNAPVRAILLTANSAYLGGEFAQCGGTSRSGLAEVDFQSSARATAWDPAPNGSVYAMALSGTTLFVGGAFGSINLILPLTPVTRNRLAAVSTVTGQASSWDPNADDDVNSLTLDAGNVYAAGAFLNIGGQSRGGIAVIDSSGAVTNWNANSDGIGYATAVGASTVYVGGDFRSIGGRGAAVNLSGLDKASGLP